MAAFVFEGGALRRSAILLVLAVVLVAACGGAGTATDPSVTTVPAGVTTAAPSTTAPEPDIGPWPTDGWPTSTPEAQGLDSDLLADMLEYIDDGDLEIDSVTVVRNGYMVLDATFYPFPPGRDHEIHSCAKSITSTLIGIAIDQGLIEGVDQQVVELLAAAAPADLDPDKAAMTVEDLLTMRTGLECRDSYQYGWQGLEEMRASADWAAHMLSLPMSREPGTRFEYCNGSSYLLSAIITEVTGGTALQYAEEVLFDPLGIDEAVWSVNAEGVNHGWGDMSLHPHDLAKIGYLFLKDGWWDGEQVFAESWVEAATPPHVAYGYQWWIENEVYLALGHGGQYLLVHPDLNLVAVITAGLPTSELRVPHRCSISMWSRRSLTANCRRTRPARNGSKP